MKPKSKKKNRHQDLTMINLDALKKRVGALEIAVLELQAIQGLAELQAPAPKKRGRGKKCD